jgi:hypothetical protein
VRFAANHLSLRQQSTSRGWQLLTALVKSSLMHTHLFLTEGLGRNASHAVGRQQQAQAIKRATVAPSAHHLVTF